MGQVQDRLCRGCLKVYSIKNDYTLDPIINATIKRLVKKRHKLYLHGRKYKDPDVKIRSLYWRFRTHVQEVLRDAY